MFSLGGMLSAIPYVLITIVGLLAYDRLIDDPSVARAARQGYVTEAEQAAMRAERDEALRQAQVAIKSALDFQKAWQDENAKVEELERAAEQEEAAYEKQLTDANRRCELSQHDLDFLLGKRASP